MDLTNSVPILLYLVDAFTFAASAVAAASTFRSLVGSAFPLFGSQMFEKLTVGWGCTVCHLLILLHANSHLLFFFPLLCVAIGNPGNPHRHTLSHMAIFQRGENEEEQQIDAVKPMYPGQSLSIDSI